MAIESSFLDIFTRYVLPPILGGGAGLFTVYANWGIEKRRQRLSQRKEHMHLGAMSYFRFCRLTQVGTGR
jgi:hypothetical protein